MSLGSLLDHTVTIWRATEAPGELRETVRTWAQVGGILPAAVNRPRARIGDAGAGLAAIGERVIYLEAGVDVAERDVVRLVSGPDAGTLWEVDGPPTQPRGHHTELVARHYLGSLT